MPLQGTALPSYFIHPYRGCGDPTRNANKSERKNELMLIIGELINCTRKKVGAAAAARDVEFFKEIARRQVAAGADMLDVNGGSAGTGIGSPALAREHCAGNRLRAALPR